MRLHPYAWLNDTAKTPLLLFLIAASIVLLIVLSAIGASLTNETSPLGIVSLELAGSESRAEAIISSWTVAAREDAFLSIGIDYLFLCIYPVAISLACHLATFKIRKSHAVLAGVGPTLSWLVLGAGLFDGIENYAMIQMLKSTGLGAWPLLATWCAIAKFGFIVLGFGYLTLFLMLQAWNRFTREAKAKAA